MIRETAGGICSPSEGAIRYACKWGDGVADSGPTEFKKMPAQRRSCGLTVDRQHLQLRERLGTATYHHFTGPFQQGVGTRQGRRARPAMPTHNPPRFLEALADRVDGPVSARSRQALLCPRPASFVGKPERQLELHDRMRFEM